ncbi:MAB_1171c family putative transporter [Amycolatopsis sp. NPDC051903]|uniref:MAB_1171c family putative transporter n=1 Tax=Amycolatopsis sp. NPDC051903 TaxID=3363936 RepID=UPI0037AD9722
MIETLAYLACVLGFAGFGVKLLEAGRDQPARTLWYLAGFGICIAFGIAEGMPAMDALAGDERWYADYSPLAGDLAKFGAIGFTVAFTRSMRFGAAARLGRHAVLSWGVIATEVVLFVLARPRRSGEDTVVPAAGRPFFVAYELVFIAYGVLSLVLVAVFFARFAVRARAGSLRTGLWLIFAGVVAAVAWTLWDLDDVASLLSTGGVEATEDLPAAALGAACVVLAVAGSTLSVWGPLLAAPLRWLRAYRAYRRIEPLWTVLREAVPGIAFDPARGLAGGAEFALYRRVIEIRDGHLALRPYFDPGLPGRVADRARRSGVPARSVAATVDAATLAAALVARDAGHRYQPDDADAPSAGAVPADVRAEAAWLVEVTRAWRHSAVVAAVRRETHGELGVFA